MERREPTAPTELTRNPRLATLTSLRFIAALMVFGSHVADHIVTGESWLHDQLDVGRVGVGFFYILSGYVLTWSASDAVKATTFYRRRFARIWPAHLVAIPVALVAIKIGGGGFSKLGTMLSIPLIQAWFSDPTLHFGGNAVSWSLSVEAFFYALAPLLIPLLRRVPVQSRRPLMAALVVGAIAYPLILATQVDLTASSWAIYVFPVARLPEFSLGCLIALEVADKRVPNVKLAFAGAVAVAAYALAAFVPAEAQPVSVTLIPFCLVIVAAATTEQAGQPLFGLERDWPVRLGAWSYAFYLVHESMLRIFADVLDSFPGLVIAAVALAAGVALSGAIYRFVERPAETRIRGG